MSLTSRTRRAGSAASMGAALAAVIGGTVAFATPAAAEARSLCGGARDKVVDVTRHIVNVDDYGTDGHIWALDTYAERIRIWRVGQVGSHQFCIHFDDGGTFRSFAGVSPNSTGTVSDGVTGTWSGTIEAYLTADFAPTAPTGGDLGTIEANCDQAASCAVDVPYPNTMYFGGSLQHVRYTTFGATFDGGAHGTWVQSLDSSTGDITG